MQKIIFITTSTSKSDFTKGADMFECPKLDKLLEDGWYIMSTENVTPPEAKVCATIKVLLEKK